MSFLKKLPTSTIVLILFALFFAVWGGYQFSLGKEYEKFSIVDIGNGILADENEGKNVCVTGKLEIEEVPTDDRSDIKANSIALVRTVEMYQYYISGSAVNIGFSSEQYCNIEGKGGESYINPSFPDDVRSKVFFAKAKIGDIVIDEEFLNVMLESNVKPVGSSYGKTVDRNYLDDISFLDYVPCGDGYLTNADPDAYEIGDIRIRFEYVDMSALGELSICGCQKNGELVTDDSVFNGVFYAASFDEIENSITADYKGAAAVFFVFSGAMVLAAALIFVKKSKKEG